MNAKIVRKQLDQVIYNYNSNSKSNQLKILSNVKPCNTTAETNNNGYKEYRESISRIKL